MPQEVIGGVLQTEPACSEGVLGCVFCPSQGFPRRKKKRAVSHLFASLSLPGTPEYLGCLAYVFATYVLYVVPGSLYAWTSFLEEESRACSLMDAKLKTTDAPNILEQLYHTCSYSWYHIPRTYVLCTKYEAPGM